MAEFVDQEAQHGHVDGSYDENNSCVEEHATSTGSISDSDSSDSHERVPHERYSVGSSKSKRRFKRKRLLSTDDEVSDEGELRRKKRKDRLTEKVRRSRDRARDGKVLRELQRNNKLLESLLDCVGKTEKCLKDVEGSISKMSSSASSSSGVELTPSRSKRHSSTRRDVPPEVRVFILHIYSNRYYSLSRTNLAMWPC